MGAKTAIVAGGTGLVGTQLLRLLDAAAEYSRVIALTRRPPTFAAARIETRAAEFERLSALLADVAGGQLDVFCCLGTTIRAAGSETAFRRVDHDHVLLLAKWAKAADARRVLVVSALGADASSRVFYNRVKGETESGLRALGLRSLVIARPSLLDGDRADGRPGEKIALSAARALRFLIPRSLQPVRDVDVAASLLLAARAPHPPPGIASSAMHGACEQL